MPLISKMKRTGVSRLLTLGAFVLMGAGVVTTTGWATPPSGPPGGQENPQKVTICHATGSETNPFVQIKVDKASIFEGHGEHQDDRDIIPAFTFVNSKGVTVAFAGQNWTAVGIAIFDNGCKVASTPSPTPTTPKPTPSHVEKKVTICHATGSETNPFVQITVAAEAILEAHSEHQNDNDIIPPFTFVNSKGETVSFPGLNFTAEGKAILENGCKVQAAPSPTATPTPTMTHSPSPTMTPTPTHTMTPTPTLTQPSGAASGTATTTAAGAGAGAGTGAGAGAGAGAGGEVTISAQTGASVPAENTIVSGALFGAGLLLLVSALMTRLAKARRGQHL